MTESETSAGREGQRKRKATTISTRGNNWQAPVAQKRQSYCGHTGPPHLFHVVELALCRCVLCFRLRDCLVKMQLIDESETIVMSVYG